jgi:signal transduction histidine kinase
MSLPSSTPQTLAPAPPADRAPTWTAEDELAVRRSLLGAVLAQSRTALLGNVVIGVTTLTVLLVIGQGWPIAVWLGLLLLTVALRALHLRRLRPALPGLDSAGLAGAEREVAVMMCSSGAVWGGLPWLAYTGANPFVDFYTIAMLVGMTAGAVNSAAALPLALNPYIVLALAPFTVRGLMLGDVVSVGGAVTILFSIAVLVGFGRSTYRAQRETLVATRENQRLARALQQERDAVQAASRAKDLFLAGVTHDLRQPVHALALYLRHLRSLQADELTPAAMAELITPMDTALRAMSGQLTRLLELSRLEAGEARVARRAWPLQELFDALSAQFTPLAEERGLKLELRPLPVVVDSDPRMLQSSVDNLVANALRYTRRGRVRVVARPRRGQRVEILVLDSGPGIEPEQLPLLFSPYRRFDDRRRASDRNGDEPGQGLGLALVKHQTELLGHPLRVRTAPGRGSVFALALPLAPAAAAVMVERRRAHRPAD